MIVRDAVNADMAQVLEIYNALFETTNIAWTESRQTLEQREAWFAVQLDRGWPVIVAEVDGKIGGFAAYGSFRGDGRWAGYRHTVEHTIHVGADTWNRGVGRALMTQLFDRARSDGVHCIVGAIDSGNERSIRFHEQVGFTQVGYMPEIGTKFGMWLDLVLTQKTLDDGAGPSRAT